MQSFLQYRAIGRAIERQHGQGQGKVAARASEREKRSAEPTGQSSTVRSAVCRASSGMSDDDDDESSSSSSHTAREPTADVEKGSPAEDVDAEKQTTPPAECATDHQHEASTANDKGVERIATAATTRKSQEKSSDEGRGSGAGMARVDTATTQKSQGTRLGHAMTGIDVRRPTTKEGGGHSDVFVVGFHGHGDPLNPHNWSYRKRWTATLNVVLIGWIVGFASSVDSFALDKAAREFHVSEVVESLATGLYLVGFGCGALVAGPFSEEFGRNLVYIVTLLLYMVFIMASALAPNIGAQCAFRFLAGFCGSTPLTCAGGSLSDLWSPMERVWAFPVFANAAFMGPIIGPIVSGFIGQSSISWRWTEWVTLIISGLILILLILTQPETFAPILLKWKASQLRKITQDDRYKAQVEILGTTFFQRVKRALYRPFLLVFREPIIVLFSLYLTVVYIILFTFLTGYTFIFTTTYGISMGLTGLAFAGIAIGLCFASAMIPFVRNNYARAYRKAEEAVSGTNTTPKVAPEIRLIWAMLGAPAIPISLFWMGWTARPDISIWSPLAASVVCGYGILCIFISVYMYLIDAYEAYAASALATVTLIRYFAAGGMVEVAIPMYEALGVGKTLSVLGGISAAMVPVPYLFWIYGKKIRGWSKYAVA